MKRTTNLTPGDIVYFPTFVGSPFLIIQVYEASTWQGAYPGEACSTSVQMVRVLTSRGQMRELLAEPLVRLSEKICKYEAKEKG